MQLVDGNLLQKSIGNHMYRVAPSELKLGYKVIRLDSGWEDSPFGGPVLVVETFEQKRKLQECCEWVVVDLSSGLTATRPVGLKVEPLYESLPVLPKRVDSLQRTRLTPESMRVGVRIYRALNRRVADFMLSFRRTGELDMRLALSISSVLARAQNLSLAALIWLTRIKDRRYYLAQHSVNTSILMAGFVHALNWSQERVETASLIGLLHDLGKSRLDLKLLRKPGVLTDDERDELRAHPVIGFELLKRNPEVSWEVSAAIHSSHERPDGKGYPRGLSGDSLPVMSRIIAIVDAYDAMTSDRTHGSPMTHQKAMGVLWKERERQFDQSLVEAFIQFLGWIPPGTLVRLSDDRLAVAIEMQANGTIRPLVRPIVGSPDTFELGPEVLLPPQFGAGPDASLRIAELLPDNAEGFGMRELTGRLFDQLDVLPEHIQELEARDSLDQAPVPVSLATTVATLPALEESAPTDALLVGERVPQQISAAPFAGLKCLVVDDSMTVRKTLSMLLDRQGFEVRAVETGEQALQDIEEESVDVVFLDILLPGMSGFSVLREFRRAKLLEETAVVMISGNPQATEQYFLERIGADDFLPKPFGQPDVAACLGRLLRRGRLQALTRASAPD